MIQLVSATADNDAKTYVVVAKADGPLRISKDETAAIVNMNVDTPASPGVLGTYSYTINLAPNGGRVHPVLWANDHHLSMREEYIGDLPAYDPDELYPTIAERQAHEARKAAQIAGITGRIG